MTAQYAGRWIIARSIVHDDYATPIMCAGSATLSPHGRMLFYDETVSFQLGKKPMCATRAYRFTSSDSAITATFADGRPFFYLRLRADGTGTAIHDCGEDRYTLTLTLTHPATWETRWDVRGTKRMSITTKYARVKEPPDPTPLALRVDDHVEVEG